MDTSLNKPLAVGPLNESELQLLTSRLASRADPPLVIYLKGHLGAGKTTFARAFLRGLGYPGPVKSPTYGLMESYAIGDRQVLHLDLYRIIESGELEFLGISDLFDSNTYLLVEWPEKADGFLPPPDLTIEFIHDGAGRRLAWYAHSSSGNAVCQSVQI